MVDANPALPGWATFSGRPSGPRWIWCLSSCSVSKPFPLQVFTKAISSRNKKIPQGLKRPRHMGGSSLSFTSSEWLDRGLLLLCTDPRPEVMDPGA
jgi:hypothetical protein